ncbi:MAG: hypothetical protein IPO27_12505 [Bacteroidetes bacterium]|nr:hypothetical protein [Bacteroidota bacterium]
MEIFNSEFPTACTNTLVNNNPCGTNPVPTDIFTNMYLDLLDKTDGGVNSIEVNPWRHTIYLSTAYQPTSTGLLRAGYIVVVTILTRVMLMIVGAILLVICQIKFALQ